MKGTVKFYHTKDDYGFIETDELDDDVYFQSKNFGEGVDQVSDGDEVEFEKEEGDQGPKAVNITTA